MWVALLLGASLRCVQLGADCGLWFDELALALELEQRDPGSLAGEPLGRRQVAPLAFVLAVKGLSSAFGVSELVLRALPFACGLASLVLLGCVGRRLAPAWGSAWGALLFAVSPSLVLAAGSLKPYAGDVCAALCLVWVSLRTLEQRPLAGHPLAGGALGSLAILLSGPAVPTAALCGLLLGLAALRQGVARPRPLLGLLAPWALAAAWASFSALRLLDPETREFMQAFWSEGFPSSPSAAPVWLAQQLYGVFAYFLIFVVPRGPLALLVLLPLGFALVGAIALLRREPLRAGIVLAPLLAAVGCALVGLLPFRGRVSLAAGASLLLCAMAGVECLLARRARIARVAVGACALLSAGLPTLAVLADTPPPYRAEPAREVLAEIARHHRPGDALYVYSGARHAIDFYGPRAGLDEWRQGETARDERRRLLQELDHYRGQPRLWFLYAHAPPRYGELAAVRAYLETLGTLLLDIPDPFGLEGERAAGAFLVDLSGAEERATVDPWTVALPPTALEER